MGSKVPPTSNPPPKPPTSKDEQDPSTKIVKIPIKNRVAFDERELHTEVTSPKDPKTISPHLQERQPRTDEESLTNKRYK